MRIRLKEPVARVLPGGFRRCPADAVERISLAAAVPQSILLDPTADLVDHGGTELHNMESVQDRDGFRQSSPIVFA